LYSLFLYLFLGDIVMSFFLKNVAGRLVNVLFVSLVAVVCWATGAQTSLAVPVTVPNFSFEASVLGDGGFDPEPIADWTFTGTYAQAGAYNSTNGEFTGTTGGPLPAPASGNNFALTNLNRGALPGNEAVSITSAASLTTVLPLSTYTLTVAMGNRLAGVEVGDTLSIELLVNDVVVPASTLTLLGSSIPGNSFADFTTSFTTGLIDPLNGGALKIQIRHSTLAGSGVATGDFDNVRLDVLTIVPPAPEPSAFALLGLGMLALVKQTRKRK
jgi:hypothetical protein